MAGIYLILFEKQLLFSLHFWIYNYQSLLILYMSSDVLNIFILDVFFNVQFSRCNLKQIPSVPFGNFVFLFPNGGNEIRTRDPLLARQVLSQLSYTPIKSGSHLSFHVIHSIFGRLRLNLRVRDGNGCDP